MKMSKYTASIMIIVILTSTIVLSLPELLLNKNRLLFAEPATLHQFNNMRLAKPPITSRISANNNNNSTTLLKSLSSSTSSSNTRSSFLIVQRGRGGNNSTKSSLVVNLNHRYYTYTKSRTPQSNHENNNNNTIARMLNKNIDVALVAPTFTAAAYDNAFYTFYNLYANIPAGRNVTSNLNLLSRKISSQDVAVAYFAMLKLINNIKSIAPNSNITLLTDASIDNGSIFMKNHNKSNAYDVLILGHQEYVTQKEYDNIKQFVANGGTLILLDGNVFFAEVKYDTHAQTVTLVKGHWWAFNGKSAWKSVGERWKQETSRWVGSNYLCDQCVSRFTNDPFEYRPHEEQYVTNQNDTLVMNYNAVLPKHLAIHTKPVIETYELNYHKGKVVALGIYSDDIINNHKFDKFFDGLLLKYAPKSTV
jgi:N,N-dimethylformamidase beta subunit-like protein